MMRLYISIILCLLFSSLVFGQDSSLPSDPKLFFFDPAKMPTNFKGNIKDLEWLTGNWRTDRGENSFREDTYMPLEGNQITAVNRAMANNKVAYMNYVVIWQEGDTVKMHHKNFSSELNLRGTRDFKLLNKDGNYFYFTGLTIHKINHNLFEAYYDFGDQKQLQTTRRVVTTNQVSDVIELNTEKELYPEGLAVDATGKKIFLNSTNQNKIVVADFDGKNIEDIKTKYYGNMRGTGVLFSNNLLYALGNNNYDSTKGADHKSVLQIINPQHNSLIRSYEKVSKENTVFNDVTIDDKGTAYITNTSEGAIYSINTTSDTSKFEIFHQSSNTSEANGITISTNSHKLFVATQNGIKIFDLSTKQLLPFSDTSTNDVDGLKYYKRSLFAIRNGQLVKYTLDDKETKITSSQILIKTNYTFDAPTSLYVLNDIVYVLSNSQFSKRSKIQDKLMDKSELTGTYILLYNL